MTVLEIVFQQPVGRKGKPQLQKAGVALRSYERKTGEKRKGVKPDGLTPAKTSFWLKG
jgi:hypothetical protein